MLIAIVTLLACLCIVGLVLAVSVKLFGSRWLVDDEPSRFSQWEPETCPKCHRPAEDCECSLCGEDATDEWMRKP